ncbi:MAG: hypothetical protein LBL84_01750 [Candidatus Nomurabacteria bacterium]|nr:hypothetical protein [Candidatus Nomurabacteria bacterium]
MKAKDLTTQELVDFLKTRAIESYRGDAGDYGDNEAIAELEARIRDRGVKVKGKLTRKQFGEKQHNVDVIVDDVVVKSYWA